MNDRVFTVAEADALLPELRERLARVRQARDAIVAGTHEVNDRLAAESGGVEGSALYEASRALRSEVETLNALGVVLRDPSTGLIDFPAVRDGEEVWLCWRDGEDAVRYWHPHDTGFSGRREL